MPIVYVVGGKVKLTRYTLQHLVVVRLTCTQTRIQNKTSWPVMAAAFCNFS